MTTSPDLKSERERLETFCNWPLASAVNPGRLAKSGFYHIGPSDRVKCAFCSGVLKSWLPNDDPDAEHRAHFPSCPFITGQNVGNIPIDRTSSQTRPSALNTTLESHRFPNMREERSRAETMTSMPSTFKQDRDLLVKAGFFYTGFADSVRCFSCGGALRNWQPSDDPWIEHARWFPRCPFVRQQKGDDFVNDIEANFRNAVSSAFVPTSPQRESPPSRRREPVSPMIQAVTQTCQMGYPEDTVQRVLLDLKRLHGRRADVSVEMLMDAVIKDEERRSQTTNQTTSQTAASGSEGSSGDPDDRITCKICMERPVEITFLPCGHLVVCEECSRRLSECPVCRTAIRGSVRTFLA